MAKSEWRCSPIFPSVCRSAFLRCACARCLLSRHGGQRSSSLPEKGRSVLPLWMSCKIFLLGRCAKRACITKSLSRWLNDCTTSNVNRLISVALSSLRAREKLLVSKEFQKAEIWNGLNPLEMSVTGARVKAVWEDGESQGILGYCWEVKGKWDAGVPGSIRLRSLAIRPTVSFFARVRCTGTSKAPCLLSTKGETPPESLQ